MLPLCSIPDVLDFGSRGLGLTSATARIAVTSSTSEIADRLARTDERWVGLGGR